MLDISQLHKNFGGLKAVNNMSLKINTGEIVGLIGPNGAGKTTFFNCISGAITPTSGSINFQGKEIMGFKPYQVCRSGLGRTYQIVKPFGKLTVKENIIVGALNSVNSIKQASELADEVMELTSLTKYSNMEAGSLPLRA